MRNPEVRSSAFLAATTILRLACMLNLARGRRLASAGRPLHRATAEQVQMQVIDRLPAVAATVDDDTIAVGQTKLGSQLLRDEQQVPEQRGVWLLSIRQGRDFAFGDDQDVRGRLRVDVTKRQ